MVNQSVIKAGNKLCVTTVYIAVNLTSLFFPTDIIVNGGDGVAAAALRDIEEKKAVVANNASKSTMIIHASRKVNI